MARLTGPAPAQAGSAACQPLMALEGFGVAGLGAVFGPASSVHQVCRAANDDPGAPWATMKAYSVGIVQV